MKLFKEVLVLDKLRFYKDAVEFYNSRNNSKILELKESITSDQEKWLEYFLKLFSDDTCLEVLYLYYSNDISLSSVAYQLGLSTTEVEIYLNKSYKNVFQVLELLWGTSFSSLDERFKSKKYSEILISELLILDGKVYKKYITDFKRIGVITLEDLFDKSKKSLIFKKVTGNAISMVNNVLHTYDLGI